MGAALGKDMEIFRDAGLSRLNKCPLAGILMRRTHLTVFKGDLWPMLIS